MRLMQFEFVHSSLPSSGFRALLRPGRFPDPMFSRSISGFCRRSKRSRPLITTLILDMPTIPTSTPWLRLRTPAKRLRTRDDNPELDRCG